MTDDPKSIRRFVFVGEVPSGYEHAQMCVFDGSVILAAPDLPPIRHTPEGWVLLVHDAAEER